MERAKGTLVKPVAVLFDIDGTLITTGGAGARSWRDAFQDLYGIPADIGRFTDAGMTDPEVGRLTFVGVIGRDPTPEEMEALMAKRLAHLPRAVAESQGYQLLDGVEETLGTLSEQGYLLGLTTGGVEAAAHIKLARAGLNHYFCFGGYGSDSTGHILGQRLDPQRTLVVGDTPKDIDAAKAVRAVAVGVASGHYGEAELREAGADYVLASLREPLPGLAAATVS
jgi:phosphoglycolate phosphatase-like HAD superfamily hydrolase